MSKRSRYNWGGGGEGESRKKGSVEEDEITIMVN
jgi:hypothetical protein